MIANGLWRDHESTPRQQKIAFSKTKRHDRPTQADVLLAMLREARWNDKRLELPEIMQAGIAQHSARFNELRRRGFDIQNEIERDARGRMLSRYWLRHDPEQDGQQ